MSLYPELDFSQIASLASHFNVGMKPEYQLLTGGSANSNYLIHDDEDEYVLTIYENKSFEDVRTLTRLLDYLQEHGFETSKCFPDKAGKNVLHHHGKPVTLRSYITGKVPEQLDVKQANSLGEQLASLHQIPDPGFLPRDHDYGVESFSILAIEVPGHEFLDWIADMSEYIRSNIPGSLPRALIHGDIFCDNLVLQGDKVAIMDFEEACYYYRVFDLGMTILGTCFDGSEPDESLIKALLKAYNSQINLEQEERNAILPATIYAATATAYWRFRQFNILTPNVDKQDDYLKMQKIAENLRAADPGSWAEYLN